MRIYWAWYEHVTAERSQLAQDEFEACRAWPVADPDAAHKTETRELAYQAAQSEMLMSDDEIPF